MNSTSGLLLIIVGLIVLYIGVTDKYCCFAGAFKCIFSGSGGCASVGSTGGNTTTGSTQSNLMLPNFSLPGFGGGGIGSGGILSGGWADILGSGGVG